MEDETKFLDIGGSIYVRIPAAHVRHFGILKGDRKPICKIEDTSKNTAKLTFG